MSIDGGSSLTADPTVVMSNGAPRPTIHAIEWTPVRKVLPEEARDFTPWLAANLELLAPYLSVEDLELVETEYAAAGFSLDILAKGVGADGQPGVGGDREPVSAYRP